MDPSTGTSLLENMIFPITFFCKADQFFEAPELVNAEIFFSFVKSFRSGLIFLYDNIHLKLVGLDVIPYLYRRSKLWKERHCKSCQSA
jgi:hypothetical protein